MSNVEYGTDATFEETVIKSDVPVMVDFWAPWCGPCQMVGPILEQLANEYAGRAKVVKINVDEETKVAGSMGIRSIPTILIYSNGEIKKQIVGAKPKQELAKLLDDVLAAN